MKQRICVTLALTLLACALFFCAALAEETSPWAALQAQIDAAPDGTDHVITLPEDVTAAPGDISLVIPAGKIILINMNHCTLDRGLSGQEAVTNGNVIRVEKGASLTLLNGTVTGGHATSFGGGFYVKGTLQLYDVTVTGNKSGHYAGGLFVMHGGVISGNMPSRVMAAECGRSPTAMSS